MYRLVVDRLAQRAYEVIMAEAGYKQLISYKLSNIAFQLGWETVTRFYPKYEDSRQRDQIKQALRSCKQNIVEGSAARSLSSKLKLYDVAKASGMEASEDYQDWLQLNNLPKWGRHDARLKKLQAKFEHQSTPPTPSYPSIVESVGGVEGKEGLEIVANYQIDIIIRCGYLLDKQINAVEQKHQREGGYRENLLRKRQQYKQR